MTQGVRRAADTYYMPTTTANRRTPRPAPVVETATHLDGRSLAAHSARWLWWRFILPGAIMLTGEHYGMVAVTAGYHALGGK